MFTLALLCSAVCAGEWVPLTVIATAYCPCTYCCGSRAAGITADGTKVRKVPYGIASDPTHLPYGTVLWIPPGHGYLDTSRPGDESRQFPVDDTGGKLRTNTARTGIIHIDLRFINHGKARRFGRKTMTVYRWVE